MSFQSASASEFKRRKLSAFALWEVGDTTFYFSHPLPRPKILIVRAKVNTIRFPYTGGQKFGQQFYIFPLFFGIFT
jgi:hypothetical protein